MPKRNRPPVRASGREVKNDDWVDFVVRWALCGGICHRIEKNGYLLFPDGGQLCEGLDRAGQEENRGGLL